MIKVLHITTVHPRFDIRIFQKECVTLQAAGYHVRLLVADGRGDALAQGVEVYDVGSARGRLQRMLILPFRAFFRARALMPDIIHIHDSELLPIALLFCLLGFRTIYDSHEDLPRAILSKHWINPRLRSVIAWISERVENFCAARMSAVVAATPHIAERFRSVQPNTVSVTNYPVLPDTLLPLIQSPEPRTFIYIGGIARQRAAREMLVAARLADARLLLVGPFEDQTLRDELMSMPEWANTEYLGVVSHDKIFELMARALAGLLLFFPEPNHINAVPNKLFEYMAGGLPIISSDFEAWRPILVERCIGFTCDPVEPESIAEAMRKILTDPERAANMGHSAQAIVSAEFRWSNEAEKLLSLYAQVSAPS